MVASSFIRLLGSLSILLTPSFLPGQSVPDNGQVFSFTNLLAFSNVMMASVVVILAFSLMAYTFTYNFLSTVARRFALLLTCVMVTYASDVALERVITAESAEHWLRFQWLGIALLPAASYSFALSVLETTNYRIRRRRWVAAEMSNVLSSRRVAY